MRYQSKPTLSTSIISGCFFFFFSFCIVKLHSGFCYMLLSPLKALSGFFCDMLEKRVKIPSCDIYKPGPFFAPTHYTLCQGLCLSQSSCLWYSQIIAWVKIIRHYNSFLCVEALCFRALMFLCCPPPEKHFLRATSSLSYGIHLWINMALHYAEVIVSSPLCQFLAFLKVLYLKQLISTLMD